MKKMISLLLCAVMVLGMLPMLPVSAATVKTEREVLVASTDENSQSHGAWTTVTEEHEVPERPAVPATPVQQRSVSVNEYGEYSFETFEDLKELASSTYAEWTPAWYGGTEDLVISEDLVIPENLDVYAENVTVIVPENVSLTIDGYLAAASITVAGTFTATSNGYFSVADLFQVSGTAECYSAHVRRNLEVTGTLYLNGNISMSPDTTVVGKENIVFKDSWAHLFYDCGVETIDELKEAIAAANDSTDSHERFGIYFSNTEEVVLTESLTIPATVASLTIWHSFSSVGLTVAEGATLTLECDYFQTANPITIHGTLENNSHIMVEYEEGGLLSFADGGTYTGTGILQIFCEPGTDHQDAVPGLDMTDVQATEHNDYSHYWELKNMAGLTQLGTPTELKWGYSESWYWDEETQTTKVTLVEGLPGSASWKTAQPDQAQAEISFYRVDGDTEEYWTGSSWHFGSMDQPEYRAVDTFILSDPESGDYYFTVTSTGDYTQYYNSETAVSDIWTYVKPNAQLGACSNLSWDGYNADWDTTVVSWAAPEDASNVGFYETEWYYAPTADDEPYSIGSSWGMSDTTDSIWDNLFQDNGIGYYYFKVRAISSDITVCCNGPWSELSPAYNVTELSEGVQDQLDNIISDSALTAEEKVDAVRDLDTNDLKTAMLADEAVVDQLLSLENETAGGQAAVEVSNNASAFDASQISIVGANLNTTVDDTEGVTLVIDKPEEEHIIPEAYDNSVAISFSMDLENVADTENLEVPVKITLPVPAAINPAFLVVLHYHADGTVEEVWPYIYDDGGQYFASFVLTSFSDFVMTEIKVESEASGDLNADGIVDDADVALLLWHTLFPENYTVSGTADFNGDTIVDDADVAYLLWHTLFPDNYPLA
ncbi:MAG: dockerin type I repeat-containing protein [Oscillospiraceae bacterium]|nr:dockerin type I repeat-containing protein [Oscillospiraceae bacterium]